MVEFWGKYGRAMFDGLDLFTRVIFCRHGTTDTSRLNDEPAGSILEGGVRPPTATLVEFIMSPCWNPRRHESRRLKMRRTIIKCGRKDGPVSSQTATDRV